MNTVYIPSFIKIGSGIQKLMGGGDTQTHRQDGDDINLLFFYIYIYIYKERSLKIFGMKKLQ
jgi:hypothetical protein